MEESLFDRYQYKRSLCQMRYHVLFLSIEYRNKCVHTTASSQSSPEYMGK